MPNSRLNITLIILLLLTGLFAGRTGKVTGKIIEAEGGTALVGVNVVLEGTFLGATTDLDGYFVILNVPPGTYLLSAGMIGFADMKVAQVVVNTDLSSEVNIEMQPEVLGLEEVTVVAERPIVIPDVASSETRIRSEVIDRLPVASLNAVIGLQAGVEDLVIRGSSSYQSTFLLDGFALMDERNNLPMTAIPLSSIQEVKIKSGGFSAEYGNMRSGIISVVTRDGKVDSYSGQVTMRYTPAGSKHFGPSIYSDNTYFTRPYLDPEVAWTGTDNGAWDIYEQRQYVRFGGYDAISQALINDSDPNNDLTPTALQRLYAWEHRRQGDIRIPDYTVDYGFGGPVPFMVGLFGNPRFYISYRTEQDAFIFPLSRDSYNDATIQVKLTVDITPKVKLSITRVNSELLSVTPALWTTPPDGEYLKSDFGVANRVTGNLATSVLYEPGYYNPISIDRSLWGVSLSHMLSDRTFHELYIQTMFNQYGAGRTADRDTSRIYEIVPGYYVDEAPYGYLGADLNSFVDGMSIGGWMGFANDKSTVRTFNLKWDITSQVNPANQLKAGVQLTYNDFRIHSANLSPVRDTWQYERDYDRYPYRFAVYARDRIEIKGFITELGLRLDHSNPNGNWYELTAYDELYTATYGRQLEDESMPADVRGQYYLSPRLLVSHPITVNSKLFFNYGHMVQELQGDFRFNIDRRGGGSVLRIGDPTLPPSRTIGYEIGYERNLMDLALLRLAAYYKDVTEQPSWSRYLSFDNSVDYLSATANNYQDIRGFEIVLESRSPGIMNGFVNYTYMVSTQGYFGLSNYFQDPTKQQDYLATNPYQEKPYPRPFLRLNLDWQLPETTGPSILGTHPLGGWKLNLLGLWKAGAYFTYNPNNEIGLVNNVQWKDFSNLDLRLSKSIGAGNSKLEIFADIMNVLNQKIFSTTGFSDFFDSQYYLESLHLPWEEGAQQGDDRPGDYRATGAKFVPIETVGHLNSIVDPANRAIYYTTVGEEYTDANNNQVWDPGEEYTDLDGSGSYAGPDSYWQHGDLGWQLVTDSYLDEVLEKKMYIDMPNLTSFTFLNPRKITVGLRFHF